jgi:diguanylate cyclase (GGDEF)-like protein/PAS domain S-box-containing protein
MPVSLRQILSRTPIKYHLICLFSLLFTSALIITAGLLYALLHQLVDTGFWRGFSAIFFSVLISTLFVVVLFSLYLASAITRPMILLAQKMSEAPEGNYDVHADENALGEVADLARKFNSYIGQLKSSSRKLADNAQESVQAEQQLKLFAKVFENALEGISITDADGNIIAVNQAFTDITGYQASEVLNQNPRILRSERHGPEFYQDMWQSLLQKGSWVGEIWNRRANGEPFPEILSISSICDEKGKTTHYVAVFHDITEMKLKEEQIKHQAYHDALTGLPNRFLAIDRLSMSLANAKRKQSQVAVFYMDLDNFKHVNDSLGHPVGDLLLQQVGQRLISLVREEDTVARLGGDEFQIIGAHITAKDEAINLAKRLLQGFNSPFTIAPHELSVTLSIGIAIYPQDGEDADTLVKNADAALYRAKSAGKNNFALFTTGE